MPELRRDPVIGQWVIVHTDDALGPDRYEKEDHTASHAATCQFCPGRERQTPPEVSALRNRGAHPNAPGWRVRVVPNKFPALKIEGELNHHKLGLYEQCNGIGAHEVVIETPAHDKNIADFTHEEVLEVVQQYQSRFQDLTGDRRFKYIMIFKNYGESAGTSVEHPHSQIIALPMIPKYVLEEIEGAQAYYERSQRCLFCDMMAQERTDKTRILSENGDFIAFCPFVPRYAFECWIMPKAHHSRFSEMSEPEQNALAGILKETLLRLKICLSDPSYNYYIHSAPVNSDEQKGFHWHIEIVPNLTKATGFEWGTGFYVVRTSPEAAAGFLRQADNPNFL
jgi:UDPglucose--hexose-1-phosphate uridylyltransferase